MKLKNVQNVFGALPQKQISDKKDILVPIVVLVAISIIGYVIYQDIKKHNAQILKQNPN